MVDASAMQIVNEIIEVHGGMEYWDSLEALDAEMSASGFLFTAKQRPVLHRVRMRAFTKEPRIFFYDFPKPGRTGELIGNDEVRIRDSDGAVVAQRKNPRPAFRSIRRQSFWDDLDFIYFGGYAIWNYLTAPFMLSRKGFFMKTLESVQGALGQFTRLHVTFPPDIPTHSREQIFYFDRQRLLHRLDYTAEVVGGWAHAAHLCDEYRTFDRLRAPTRRWVLPLLFGHKPLPRPTLVAIELHSILPVQ